MCELSFKNKYYQDQRILNENTITYSTSIIGEWLPYVGKRTDMKYDAISTYQKAEQQIIRPILANTYALT